MNHYARHRGRGFTLIELLVVIVIIGILAGLIVQIVSSVDRKQKLAVAQIQPHEISQAIDGYHTKLGFYPPDNPNNVAINPLYFELLGTTNDAAGKPAPTTWVTLDHSAQITSTDPTDSITTVFGVQGLGNTSPRAQSDDQAAAASSFLNHLMQNQIGSLPNNPQIKVLVCPVEWPSGVAPAPINGTQLNPWRYNSSHPTNNPGSYDLWVDLVIGGKTYRVDNWTR
jgi:prepilin-type N-terminal cleavage/methylation domain-containing protein